MKIYHGSSVVVSEPKILESERMLDFGAGFYTTSNREQAVRWAEIVANRKRLKSQILSIYEFDYEVAERNLVIIRFDKPDGEWLDFVSNNRMGRQVDEYYDVAIGPVANDKVYSVVQFYENGIYNKEDAIKRLKVEKLFDQ